jgi:predicted DNA-binding transcriptional regulator YafY
MGEFTSISPWSLKAEIDYTNHRGEKAKRRIVPLAIYLDVNNQWHGTAWILRAFDLDKQAIREFAMRDIDSWADWT